MRPRNRPCEEIIRYSKDVARVTSKYQVTLPGKIADAGSIRPGDNIDSVAAGKLPAWEPPEARLRLFDQATERLRLREFDAESKRSRDRGRSREDLYRRG